MITDPYVTAIDQICVYGDSCSISGVSDATKYAIAPPLLAVMGHMDTSCHALPNTTDYVTSSCLYESRHIIVDSLGCITIQIYD